MNQTTFEALAKAVGKFYATERMGMWMEKNPEKLDKLLIAVSHYKEQILAAKKEGITPTQILAMLYALEADSEAQNKVPISCRAGCSFCCHINVTISDTEAQLIREFCKAEGIPIDWQQLKKQLPLTKDTHARSEHSKCAFLKNGLCSIYLVRPFNCRNYFVASPAENCDAKKYPKYKVAVFVDENREVLHSALLAIGMGKEDSMARIFLSKHLKKQL